MQGFAPGDAQATALADREVLDTLVLAHHPTIAQHDLTGPGGQVGIQERLHRAVVIRQAEVLAFGLGSGAQAVARRLSAGVGLGEFAEGKHQTAKVLLGQVVEEVALVLALIQATQQLVATVVALSAWRTRA